MLANAGDEFQVQDWRTRAWPETSFEKALSDRCEIRFGQIARPTIPAPDHDSLPKSAER
jgi:hypothetical protein